MAWCEEHAADPANFDSEEVDLFEVYASFINHCVAADMNAKMHITSIRHVYNAHEYDVKEFFVGLKTLESLGWLDLSPLEERAKSGENGEGGEDGDGEDERQTIAANLEKYEPEKTGRILAGSAEIGQIVMLASGKVVRCTRSGWLVLDKSGTPTGEIYTKRMISASASVSTLRTFEEEATREAIKAAIPLVYPDGNAPNVVLALNNQGLERIFLDLLSRVAGYADYPDLLEVACEGDDELPAPSDERMLPDIMGKRLANGIAEYLDSGEEVAPEEE